MAESRKSGLAALPAGIFRPTVPAEDAAPPAEPAEDEGRGEIPATEPKRPRRATKGAAARTEPRREGETRSARKLVMPDDLYDRLQLLAIRRRLNVSEVVVEILEASVPRLWIGGPATGGRTGATPQE